MCVSNYQAQPSVCPTCGTCPTCGSKRQSNTYQYVPYQQPYTIGTWPTFTWTATNGTGVITGGDGGSII